MPPLRVHLTVDGLAADFTRLLAWRRQSRGQDETPFISALRPRLAPNLQLTIRHVVNNGQLVPGEFTFSVDGGFRAHLKLDGWVTPLLARFDGARTVGEVYESALQADELPPGFPLKAFANLVKTMLDRGFFFPD